MTPSWITAKTEDEEMIPHIEQECSQRISPGFDRREKRDLSDPFQHVIRIGGEVEDQRRGHESGRGRKQGSPTPSFAQSAHGVVV